MAEGLTLSNLHDDFGTRFQMARPTCPQHIPWLLMLAFGGLGNCHSPVIKGAGGSAQIHSLRLFLKWF